jgi:large subunit ribosomal protein L18
MQTKLNKLTARRNRVRAKLREQVGRARLTIFRSNAHIWAQIIDDVKKVTLASASDLKIKGTKVEKATKVGEMIAVAGKAAKVTQVVFDRSGYRFHGRVKALATAARAGGLEF